MFRKLKKPQQNHRPRPLITPLPPARARAAASGGTVGSPLAGYAGRRIAHQGLSGSLFAYTPSGRAGLYRYLRDSIPIVSAAVWAWVRLCATPQTVELNGSESEVERAKNILDDLDRRILENPYLRGKGVDRLTEAMFLDLFTLGRFGGELVLLPDGSGLDYFHALDPFRVKWERAGQNGRWKAGYDEENGSERALHRERTFYTTLGMDSSNPAGIEPLASIPFVLEIEQRLLEDMARSSHNAGTPRLQVKIAPPKPFENENEEEYLGRINAYFDQTVEQFSSLEADQNLFTWSDVEVTIVGGDQGRSFTWKVNREQVLEDVITGLKLFPWVLGRSHGTTMNWVGAQYNLLMQEVDSIQGSGSALADWLYATELKLRGCSAQAKHVFAPNQDPFILERAQAEEIRFRTVDGLVEKGYVTKEEGKRKLGI
jgi:hypothetical protein